MAETVEGRRLVEGRARYDACPGHRAGIGMSPQSRAHGSELHGYPIPRRPITSDLRQEPGALAAHAGICAGGGWQRSSLPRPTSPNHHSWRTDIASGSWPRPITASFGGKAVIACCSCSGLLVTQCMVRPCVASRNLRCRFGSRINVSGLDVELSGSGPSWIAAHRRSF